MSACVSDDGERLVWSRSAVHATERLPAGSLAGKQFLPALLRSSQNVSKDVVDKAITMVQNSEWLELAGLLGEDVYWDLLSGGASLHGAWCPGAGCHEVWRGPVHVHTSRTVRHRQLVCQHGWCTPKAERVLCVWFAGAAASLRVRKAALPLLLSAGGWCSQDSVPAAVSAARSGAWGEVVVLVGGLVKFKQLVLEAAPLHGAC